MRGFAMYEMPSGNQSAPDRYGIDPDHFHSAGLHCRMKNNQ
jgi:hypothetical protein